MLSLLQKCSFQHKFPGCFSFIIILFCLCFCFGNVFPHSLCMYRSQFRQLCAFISRTNHCLAINIDETMVRYTRRKKQKESTDKKFILWWKFTFPFVVVFLLFYPMYLTFYTLIWFSWRFHHLQNNLQWMKL